jgi:aryl-alcohol dehydrogenase-like predicted oxidoreductase
VNLVTLSVAWVLTHPAVSSPIIGASRPGQLDASIAGLDYQIDPELKQRLDDLTHDYRIGDAPR